MKWQAVSINVMSSQGFAAYTASEFSSIAKAKASRSQSTGRACIGEGELSQLSANNLFIHHNVMLLETRAVREASLGRTRSCLSVLHDTRQESRLMQVTAGVPSVVPRRSIQAWFGEIPPYSARCGGSAGCGKRLESKRCRSTPALVATTAPFGQIMPQ